jgi:uncharacterized damage-inducible protein DinB
MTRIGHIRLMAAYNAAMNAKVYGAAASLDPGQLFLDRKAFFGSIFGTLSHLAAGDAIWLGRFAGHPAQYAALEPLRHSRAPTSLRDSGFADLPSLATQRRWLDGVIAEWAGAIAEHDLDHVLSYTNSAGAMNKDFHSLVMHFFNHQTHHRGQCSTLLSQAGADIGVTDLLALIPDSPGSSAK